MYRKGSSVTGVEVAIVVAIILIIGSIAMSKGCSQQSMAKNWGGNMEIALPADTKLVNVTWKESELWYVTRPMRKGEAPEVYTFHEKSNFGILEGTITLKESVTSVESK